MPEAFLKRRKEEEMTTMENLIFSLNATLPIFLMMVLGWVFRQMGLMRESFVSDMNRFVFRIALPVLVFSDLASVDFVSVWDTRFVLFCFLVTAAIIAGISGVSFLLKEKNIQGEFIQGAYRSSAAILGIAFMQNLYGNAGMAPLMILAAVPLYNIAAVIVLSVFCPRRGKMDAAMMKKTIREVVTNPILIGIAAGMLWSLFQIPMYPIMEKTVKNVAALATPMGLMAMGAAFDPKKLTGKIGPAIWAALIKLVFLAALFLPFAVWLGFRREKLIAILVMLGSSTTVSCYVMAKNMGHEGVLTSGIVMLTTLFSAFTLTGWLYLLKTLALI